MTACWVHNSLSLTLDSTPHYLPGQPALNSRVPAERSVCCSTASVPVWPLGDNWWGWLVCPASICRPTGSLADAMAAQCCLISAIICVAVTFKFVSDIRGNDRSSAWHNHGCPVSMNPASNPDKWQWTLRKPVRPQVQCSLPWTSRSTLYPMFNCVFTAISVDLHKLR